MVQRLATDELFRLCPWRKPDMDLSIYSDLEWTCGHSGKSYKLGESNVALEGGIMRLLVSPPASDLFSVVKIKGFFKRRLLTEYAAPSRAEINAYFDRAYKLDVVDSPIRI